MIFLVGTRNRIIHMCSILICFPFYSYFIFDAINSVVLTFVHDNIHRSRLTSIRWYSICFKAAMAARKKDLKNDPTLASQYGVVLNKEGNDLHFVERTLVQYWMIVLEYFKKKEMKI